MYLLFIRPLETYCSYPYVIAVAIPRYTCMVQNTDTHTVGTHASHMGEARVLAHTRIWATRTRTGIPSVRIWAASARMGCPYAYGAAHTRMGRISVWDGTKIRKSWNLEKVIAAEGFEPGTF